MNKILISLILLCTALWPCKAQLVGPGGKPADPTTIVAKFNTGEYTSLGTAFAAVNGGSTEPATIQLQLSVTLNEATSLTINKTTTLSLSNKQLDCPHGLTATVAQNKVFTFMKGTLSGSLIWDGGGNLFAGVDVDLSGLTVTKSSTKLYRVLVKLPAGCGTVKDAYFGKNGFITFAQSGDVLCCWLPQYAAIQDIIFNGDSKRYLVSGVIVNQHATTILNAVENEAPDLDIAEVSFTNSDPWTKYETLKQAFNALSAQNGTIKLRSQASFAESLPITQTIDFDLKNYQLTASGGAVFKATGSGQLHVKNGNLSGLLRIEGDVVIDKSVVMAGVSVLNNGGASVYRVRLVLPADVAGKTLTYSYNGQTDIPIARTFTEDSEAVAYLWLPAKSTGTPFTLTVTNGSSSTSINKNDITINTNHDNTINLVTGDMEAELDVVGTGKTQYTTFHEALEAAKKANKNCTITLLNNVGLSGNSPHAHALVTNQIVTIDLNGHNLTGGNCWLQATETGSAYIITDTKNTGSLTGQLQIEGCVHIKDIAASKIGQVVDKDATGTPLYRLIATIAGSAETGFVTYTWDGGGTSTTAYAIDGKVCLFQTAGNAQHTLGITTSGSQTYSASGIILAASHSNVTTVRLPGEVASIGSDKFASLAEALTAANSKGSPVTIELLNHATLNSKQSISKDITIDLKEFTLTMEGNNCEWDVTSGNSLYIKSTSKTATIQGNFKVSDNVCISADVTISGSVTKGADQVYRTRFFLPATTKEATYKFNSQTGSLIFPGETRDNGQKVGYAFLQVESGYADLTATITDPGSNSYTLKNIFLQAFHNNQFDMQAGDNVAKVNGTQYTLFSAALQAVNANTSGGTIELLRSITLSGIQGVTNDVTIDLSGNTLNMTDDAHFNITDTKTLTIKDSETTKGFLYGIYRLQGSLFVASDVSIAGTVVHEGHELYRHIVKGIGTYDGTSAYKAGSASLTASIQKGIGCFWLPAISTEQDLTITAGTDTYEATLLPALPNHNSQVQAYKRVEVTVDETWSNADNANTNVYLKAGIKLTLNITTNLDQFSLHRVTMENGAEIITEQPLLATEGIVYRYAFSAANQWYPFSVPYNVRMIRRSVDGVQSEIQPYLADGTGGHFWLKTLSAEGGFNFMAEEKIRANVGYVMAVPTNLTSSEKAFVDFVSPANQFLNRKQVALPTVQTGKFYLVAPGTLQTVKLKRSFYQLDADGKEFRLMTASATSQASIPPFTSFLLADAQTMATYSRLAMDRFPTAVEPIVPVSDPLLITSGKGYIRVESTAETLLAIYTRDGKLVNLRRIPSGTTEVSLPSGLYFVNRQKVIVR